MHIGYIFECTSRPKQFPLGTMDPHTVAAAGLPDGQYTEPASRRGVETRCAWTDRMIRHGLPVAYDPSQDAQKVTVSDNNRIPPKNRFLFRKDLIFYHSTLIPAPTFLSALPKDTTFWIGKNVMEIKR